MKVAGMEIIESLAELESMQQQPALIMFGGAQCAVCASLKPRIDLMLAADFPRLKFGWADCQGAAGAACAQAGVFSLPVVQLWFDGKKHAEFAGVFSLGRLRHAIERPYRMIFAPPAGPKPDC
ncbi:MAG TPA: thioredoxin family protein [Wenzhouxiangella sp.]|nr:thioredoxin family protein [Wenzhouxiangella sp.]